MKKLLSILLVLLMAVGLFACNDNTDNPNPPTPPAGSTGGEITVPTQESFNFNDALANASGWLGLQKQNPVFDEQNKFVTFREKSNNVITYNTVGMSTGDIELKLKVQINKDTTAYVGFNNQSEDLKAFCYDEGSYMYTLEFANDSKMYVKKWTDGAESLLSGSKSSASVPIALASRLTSVKISVTENGSSISIVVYVGGKEMLNVTDSSDAYLGGGAITLSYMGAGGMVVGARDSADASYVAPEPLGLSIYDSPDVEQFTTGTLNLLENFEANWVGRERIFSYEKDSKGYVFTSKDNPEEPQAGVTEYQAVYKNKIFGNVQMEYSYNQVSNGEWTMFWLRCVPESSTDVSIWGNKKTGQNTNGYSMLITFDGYVQIHKWNDGSQIWLNGQGTKLPGPVIALLNDANQTINVKMSIEEVEIGGKPSIEFRVCVNDTNIIVVQDSDTPYLNAGYIGMQGFATNNKVDSIRLLSATVTDTITL
ncbi:MAG: hypothetical protein IJF71_06425 [Clostridia bacterium]|nr:hypothetical protein [Clostridia bacterium]